ncbi:MAG: PHP domain-containing protein [Clostridia bacterium]|nr:PHP domain-containing protein [Clostridia bacterium]
MRPDKKGTQSFKTNLHHGEGPNRNVLPPLKADLHTHTTASDGSMTPTKVVDWAKKGGLDVVAITDHDTVAGLAEGKKRAEEVGIKFVPGVELSTFAVCEIHILGYNIPYENPEFLSALDAAQNLRIERNKRIGEKLAHYGFKLDIDFSAKGVGRMNMARDMVQKGYVKDVQEAFDKWLGTSGKVYCETRRLSPLDAVKLIKEYGGIASIAHPKKYLLDGRLDMLVEGLKKFGLDGIEVNYPSHTDKDRQDLVALARKYGLLQTGGSDFHGDEDKDFVFLLDARTKTALLRD